MPPRSPLPLLQSTADSRAAILQGLLIAAIVIGALYFGREVLLPLAIAILLSFVLTPPLLLLRRIKVPRVLAVALVVVTAFAIIGGLGWLISREATKLAADLPSYRLTLSQKIQAFRESTSESKVLEKAGDVLSDLQAELDQPVPDAEPDSPEVGEPADRPQREPIPVEIREPAPTGIALYRSIAGTLLPPLVTAGIVLLFVVFILLQREDLRDRLIRLFGGSDLQRATSTMSDAATRLSRYFLSQVLINAAYGAFIALALWAIGMPSPIAWGILAMLMRFVPYVGSYIAAAVPVIIAAAIDPGWTMVLMVLGLFVVGELTMGQVVEPLVFGRGAGVTPIAVIGCTILWTWLWGPLGLLIATPITVCLAVLGRHVEGLRFLEVLLSDRPALLPEESFYQRALTGDAAEATYQAELSLKDQSLEAYLGGVALGGLKLAQQDAERGALDGEQCERIAATVNEMLENLADFEPRRWFQRFRNNKAKNHDEQHPEGLASLEAHAEEDDHEHMVDPRDMAPGWEVETPILVIGGRTMLDEAAGAMLAAVVAKRGVGAEALPPEAISPGHITALSSTRAKLVCLSYLGVGSGPAQIRYLVRRLRRILPEGTLIVVAYWSRGTDAEQVGAFLESARSDAYVTTLEAAVDTCIEAATGELTSTYEEPEPTQASSQTKRPPAVTPPPPKGKGRKAQTAPA
jgi:predicted PurR-regulated permease PerM